MAQPREYKSKEAAGQMRRSPHQFTGIGSLSPTLWLARGYAVLDGPGFPIVAEGDEEPNDTYVEQLTASAEAAVKVSSARGALGCRGSISASAPMAFAHPASGSHTTASRLKLFGMHAWLYEC